MMSAVNLQEPTRVRTKATIPTVQPVVAVSKTPRWVPAHRRLRQQVQNSPPAQSPSIQGAQYEWQAAEHTHRPKSAGWYIALAASITALAAIFLFMANFMAALTVGLAGGLIYYLAQRHPAIIHYRLLADGIAVNNTLYLYRNLKDFHVLYQPEEARTVVIRGVHRLAPLLHLEIGEADPGIIRDILIKHVAENVDLQEPLVDIWARRLGF